MEAVFNLMPPSGAIILSKKLNVATYNLAKGSVDLPRCDGEWKQCQVE